MAVKRFTAGEAVHERSDAEYQCVFNEAAVGEPTLNAAAILTIKATLRDQATETLVNALRPAEQDVKNVNGGTLAADGTFVLHFTGLVDMVIVTAARGTYEEHRLVLEVTYTKTGGGTGYLNHQVHFYVIRLADVG